MKGLHDVSTTPCRSTGEVVGGASFSNDTELSQLIFSKFHFHLCTTTPTPCTFTFQNDDMKSKMTSCITVCNTVQPEIKWCGGVGLDAFNLADTAPLTLHCLSSPC